MKLVEMTVGDFAELMASGAPAPGGGSASALNGALGAGLVSMVCALTQGKKKYLEHEQQIRQVQAEALALKDRFAVIIDKDTEAFNGVCAVFAMPKNTEEERAARKAAMQQALKGCTVSPYEMMELSYRGLELITRILGKTNADAASDLGCAVLNLKSAIQGAWLNVCINLGGIEDAAFREEYRQKGEALLQKALPMAESAYERLLSDLL